MAKPDFWNDNRFRSYPFLSGSTSVAGAGTIENIPDDVIVDAGFTMGLDSGYVAGEHSVWLDSVSRSGSTLTFSFESDAPGLFNRPLRFTREIGDDEYQVSYVDSVIEVYDSESASIFAASLVDDDLFLTLTDSDWLLLLGDGWYLSTEDGNSVSFSYDGDDDCDVPPLWSGFLVAGHLDALAAVLVSGSTWEGNSAEIEPALVTSLVDGYLANLSVANADRTRVNGAQDCPDPTWPHPTGEIIHINQTCLQGHIRFKAGYSTEIEQVDDDNQIIIVAEPGAGEGLPGSKSDPGTVCDEVPFFDGETPPEGSTLYEGGPRCNEVVRSINGLGGQLLTVLDGTGVAITELPAENKLIINVDMTGLAVCYTDILDVSESV